MSYALYRILTHALWPVAAATAALRGATGSPEWPERAGRIPDRTRGAVWLHAASVGEVAAIVPLARELAVRDSGVFLTVVSPTGRTAASRSLDGVPVSFAPLDFVTAVRRVIDRTEPRALLLTETEIWPNTVYECAKARVPVGMVNGRLSEKGLRRYTMAGSPMRRVAEGISFAACRTEEDAARYRELGIPDSRVSVAGDMKFDKLEAPLGDAERSELRTSLGIPDGARVVVFGSVRPDEEADVAAAVSAVLGHDPVTQVVVAPRHLARVEHIVKHLDINGVRSTLRSEGRAGDVRAVVLDTTGELSRVYGVADVAFVGGTLAPYGGHDPLEPAAQGVPVLIGRHTQTCRHAADRLKSAGGAVGVESGGDLIEKALGLLGDDEARGRAGAAALRVVEEGRGATARTIDFLEAMGALDGQAV